MIRPLTKEEELQNLEKMDMSELRGEFVEQTLQFRRKVLNRMKPKIMNGKKLSGRMLAGLVHQYVDAVNSGTVPNIENAWIYVCKNECQKALNDSIQMFEQDFQSEFDQRAPMHEDEL